MRIYRRWTKEEEFILREMWGKNKRTSIQERLGRTDRQIEHKAGRMGLGNPIEHRVSFSTRDIADAFKIDYKIVHDWIKIYGLPARKTSFGKRKYVLIQPEKFWKWAACHRDKIDFTKIEVGDLAPQPAWVQEERRIKKQKRGWTDWQHAMLRSMIQNPNVTYQQIEEVLGKSEKAVRNKLNRMGIAARPNTGKLDMRFKENRDCLMKSTK